MAMIQSNKINVAVFVSGGGTNLQAIIDATNNKIINSASIKVVISSNKDAYALTRAKNEGIDSYVFDNKSTFEVEASKILEQYNIDLIVLAGFMSILSQDFTSKYSNKILNVHPALIPAFCGKGFYGLRVHKAVLDYGVKITGATVHYVNEIPDGGKIILQKSVNVNKNDTPKTLQERVMKKAEWVILPKAIEIVSKKIIKEKGNGTN
jgi:phosphoribosylglycinamide formyltransferase-1